MNRISRTTIRRWIPFFVLLLGVLLVSQDAIAQSRQRERTARSKNTRVERTEKKTKARSDARKRQTTRVDRSAGKTETARSRSQSRTRQAPQQRETRQRGTQTTRTRSTSRTRQTDISRAPKPQTRSSRTPSNRSTPSTRTSRTPSSRSTPSPRTGRQVEPGSRGGTSRGTTRSGSNVGNQQSRTRSGEVNRTRRTTRDQERPQSNRRGNNDRVERSPRSRAGNSGQRVDRTRDRRDYQNRNRRTRYVQRDSWHQRYQRDNRYHRKHWKRRHANKRRYYNKPFYIRPFIHIDVRWPWVHRHRHGWRPRYQYRQVIYVDAGWGNNHRRSQIDVRTYYYHELRHATNNRAEIDIYVERIELYQNGRYIGDVQDIPERLGRIRATVHRDGHVDFDRNVFVVGDLQAGFELISTRYYDGFLLDSYRAQHGMRVGAIDLRRGRVVPTSYSYLFNPHDFNGFVPVSLLPDDTSWLLDYGEASFSAAYYDSDPYYYGGYNDYGSEYDDDYYGDDYYEEDYYEDDRGRPYYSVRSTVAEANFNIEPVEKTYSRNYQTSFGANISLKREAAFVRVK